MQGLQVLQGQPKGNIMLRRHPARRAVRLLGAVAVTGALSAGALTTSSAAAETSSSTHYSGVYAADDHQYRVANGLRVGYGFRFDSVKRTRANGL